MSPKSTTETAVEGTATPPTQASPAPTISPLKPTKIYYEKMRKSELEELARERKIEPARTIKMIATQLVNSDKLEARIATLKAAKDIHNAQKEEAIEVALTTHDSDEEDEHDAARDASGQAVEQEGTNKVVRPQAKKRKATSTAKKTSRAGNIYKSYPLLRPPYNLNEYVEVFETGGKGNGLRTRIASIPAGTLILSEQALIGLHQDGDSLEEVVDDMDDDTQTRFKQLCYDKEKGNNAQSRMDINQWSFYTNTKSVFADISLANHSCRPNCWLPHEDDDIMLTGGMRTLIDLPRARTELTLDYQPDSLYPTPHLRTRYERTQLFEKWGFDCACSACGWLNQDGEADYRRTQINAQEKALKCNQATANTKLEDVESLMMDYITNLTEERRPGDVATAHKRAKEVYERAYKAEVDDQRRGTYLLKWVHHLRGYLNAVAVHHGPDSDEVLDASEDLAGGLKTARTWRKEKDAMNLPPTPRTRKKLNREARKARADAKEEKERAVISEEPPDECLQTRSAEKRGLDTNNSVRTIGSPPGQTAKRKLMAHCDDEEEEDEEVVAESPKDRTHVRNSATKRLRGSRSARAEKENKTP